MLRLITKNRISFLALLQTRLASGYDKEAMTKLSKPGNVGKLDANSPDVGTGMVGSPACGDVFKVQIKVGANGVIEKAVFKVMLCFIMNTFHRLSAVLVLLLHQAMPQKFSMAKSWKTQ